MNKQKVHERLVAIARAESADEVVCRLLKERSALYDAVIQPLDDAIDTIRDVPQKMRDSLKQDVLDYVAETGDTDIHDLIDFRRKSRWQYDKDAALAWAKERGMVQCIRVKESLIVKEFNSVLDDWAVDGGFPDAEKVATPEVAIKKLSHLLD